MKICHIIHSIDRNAGGTSTTIQSIVNELVKYIRISIITTKSKDPLPINPNVEIFSTFTSFPLLQGYSIELKSVIKYIDCDLFHGHGSWQFPVHFMTKVAQRKNKPYIISTHGSLEPWALRDGKWKKKIALCFYQRNDLALASCILTTAKKEADNLRRLKYRNPIAIIPNGVDLAKFTLPQRKQESIKHTIVFLSRIHKVKGLELLIEAWEYLPVGLKNEWQIKIAGNGNPEYIESLQQLINRKCLGNEIFIIGPQFGQNQLNVYQEADIFVLPSYSENFGNVVAEALACGVPVITTKGTPWEELNTYNAGWWIDIGVEPLIKALEQSLQLSDPQRQQMGQNGRRLVEEKYSNESVARKMVQLYEWVLKGGEKPEFVYSD